MTWLKMKPQFEADYERLQKWVRKYGRHFPKKHGEWYRVVTFIPNTYLVLDTWNGFVYIHEGAEDSGTDNMYRVVYVFSGGKGYVRPYMARFWATHIKKQ